MESIENKKVKKEPFLVTVFGLFVLFYMAHKLLPAVGYYTPAIAYLGCFAIIAALLVTSTRKIASSKQFVVLLLVFALNVTELIYMFCSNVDFMSIALSLYGELQTFLFGWIALWYISYGNKTKTKNLLYIIFAFYVITAITTAIGNLRHPGASRMLATSLREYNVSLYNQYVSENIGGFSFIYGLMMVMPLVIYMMKKRKVNLLLATAGLIFAGAAVVCSEYTTALIVFVANMPLLLFKGLTTKKIILLIVICIIVMAIASTVIASAIDEISELFSSQTISSRLKYIAATLRGEDNLSDIEGSSDRMTLYKKAWDEILESNFLGNWGATDGSGHSMMLDTVVKYGVLGIALIAIMYGFIYKFAIYPYRKKEYYPYFVWVYLISIFLAALNPDPNLFVLICVLPLFAHTVDDKQA